MGIARRLFRGTDGRKTRLHDLKGNRIGLNGLRYLPHSVASTLARVLFGIHQKRPWLGYRATKHLEDLIQPSWRLLEFGSGMSTVWFASRCKEIVSVEHDKQWYEKVSRILVSHNVENCDYRLVSPTRDLCLEDYPKGHFDFVLVDGIDRTLCMKTALAKVRDNGWIYLDNSDFNREAEELLMSGKTVTAKFFHDFVPGNIMVTEGILAQVTSSNEGKCHLCMGSARASQQAGKIAG